MHFFDLPTLSQKKGEEKKKQNVKTNFQTLAAGSHTYG
jgi:hypothetical protein